MTATTAASPIRAARRPAVPYAAYEPGPLVRAAVGLVGVGFTAACAIGLVRFAAGLAPAHAAPRDLAVMLHLATVLPAVPLGAWLMLSRKGTARHKLWGKVWVVLMILTALSALFIRQINGGQLSPIHIFVPMTLWGAWKTVATARRGDIAGHRKQLVGFYLGALTIPGLFAFLPGRMMWTWLVG
ncbi:MAG TPA: DUF2306 domain-containing protein [Novosphingobium sp.]|nr:DUF2306 domain-containing protein [Novosphingobium sp.]